MGGIHAAGAQLVHQPLGREDIAEDLHQATRRTAPPETKSSKSKLQPEPTDPEPRAANAVWGMRRL